MARNGCGWAVPEAVEELSGPANRLPHRREQGPGGKPWHVKLREDDGSVGMVGQFLKPPSPPSPIAGEHGVVMRPASPFTG